jgi:diguanylate cyclase (GGDEF)-like protein/PAS domain S-box-containing protein
VGKSERLDERFLALLDRNQEISAADDLHAFCERVLDAAQTVLHHDSVALLLVDDAGEFLELTAFRGDYRGVKPGLRLALSGKGITTWVAAHGEPQIVPDVSQDPRYVSGGLERGSELAVPMRLGDRVSGVLDVQRAETFGFSDEDAILLQALASHAAVALGSLRVREDLERQKARVETILQCSADAIITADSRGHVTFFSRGAEEMFGYRAEDVLGTQVASYYLEGEKEARRVQRYIEEEGKVRNYEVWFKAANGERIPTSLSASLLRDREGHVLGTLGILKDVTVEKRLERKLSYTIEMLQEANENLGRMAMTDSLSGLKNQRFFRRKLEEEMLRSGRTRRPISLLLVDIDKFKRFNDSYGHQVGDQVIQEMGRTILQSIRKIDHGCRYGGEEFTVILPETPLDNALVVARRVQQSFAKSVIWTDLGIEAPTLSIGLVAHDEGSATHVDADALVKRADDAMYRAKRRGGNEIETG